MPGEPSSKLAAGALVAGKLRILRPLGAGGMASVYEVEHTITKKRCALKLLHHRVMTPDVVARFLREASAAGHIGDPHIVETLDAGTLDTGEPYIVMELLEGRSLADYLAQAGPLPVSDLVSIVRQACGAIDAAHRAGIVHRDLKPDNLHVSVRSGEVFVKVLDFGISKFDVVATGATGLTQEGAFLGTPYYMAPEQIRGDAAVDGRADVYALGVILYECAVGKRPFEAETLTALAILIHEGRPAPIATLRPDLPPALADVIAKAMHVDASQRYPTPRALAEALAPFAGAAGTDLALAKTEAAPAAEAPRIARRPADRSTPRRGKLVAGAVIVAIVLVGGAAVGVFAWRARAVGVVSKGAERPTGMTLIRGGAHSSGRVGDFFLDVSEVTVEAYRACVKAGACTPANTDDPRCNFGNDDRLFHPINCVDWEQATAFCAAYGKRLPTELEWEWAARGGAEARVYPWGDDPPAKRACWNGAGNDVGEGRRESTCPIGKFLNGASANEVHDLAGNVWEWTSSTFERTNKRVVRGGSWHTLEPDRLTASYRFRREPDERDFLLGFRCARDAAR